jgi:hypothetical protein
MKSLDRSNYLFEPDRGSCLLKVGTYIFFIEFCYIINVSHSFV